MAKTNVNDYYFDFFGVNCKRKTPKDRAYAFWFDKLLLIACRVFKYKNLPANLPAWEIEKRLILGGRCFVFKNETYGVITSFGATSGVNIYNNSNEFNYAQAILGSESRMIDGVDGVIMYGASIDKINGVSGVIGRKIQYYADILSDIDISRRVGLINNRSTRSIIAKSDNAVTEIKQFYTSLINGELAVPKITAGVLDATEDINKKTSSFEYGLIDFDTAQNNVLKQFYADFGIAYSSEKRERLLVDEVNAGFESLDINIDDMLQCRIDGINAINNLYGTAITVGVISNDFE